jgi:hypothetical protein
MKIISILIQQVKEKYHCQLGMCDFLCDCVYHRYTASHWQTCKACESSTDIHVAVIEVFTKYCTFLLLVNNKNVNILIF